MDHLTKHQLILVALLVSFVTSLATGIVTVSLMDQVPQGVTRTITQVIQQTVAGAVPASGATSTVSISIAVYDQVADATAFVTPSIVRLRDGDIGKMAGLGLIVSKSGDIIADKTLMDTLNNPQAVFSDGTSLPIVITRFQMQGDIAFMKPLRTVTRDLKPITFGVPARLGASVWSLAGTTTYNLAQGIVSNIEVLPSKDQSVIGTTIQSTKLTTGAPLFDATGAVIGITTNTLSKGETGYFYPVLLIKDGIPK